MDFRVIIFGGRYFNNYFLCKHKVKNILSQKIAAGSKIIIVSGACNTGYETYNHPDDGTSVCGADGLGEKLAAEMGWPVERYPADWQKHGKAAGPIRNRQMGKIADVGIGFWDNESSGTKDMIDVLQEIEKKPCRIILFVAEVKTKASKKKAA